MTDCISVVTSTAEKAHAQKIAEGLLRQQLAACVQISGPIESHFRWKGVFETSQEWVCTIKTRRDLFPQVETAIRKMHPYEVPEIIALPVEAVSSSYLIWLKEQVKRP